MVSFTIIPSFWKQEQNQMTNIAPFQTPHLFSVYESIMPKQRCPALNPEEHFPVDFSTNSLQRSWSPWSHGSGVYFSFFAAVLKSLIYIIDLHAMSTRQILFNKLHFLKKKKLNETTALTFTFRHPMSLDCRIQLFSKSGFLIPGRRQKQSCRVLFQLQAHPSSVSLTARCAGEQNHSTGKWLYDQKWSLL